LGNSIGSYDLFNQWQGYSLFCNRFLFTGREWLPDVRLYDYRNRIYQPELGRFLQPDPKEFAAGDYNLYRYCHNDPVNKTDPLGLAPGDPFGSPEAAARDVHSFINPTSIKQNAEYGSVIYQVGDKFYASPTFTNGAQTRVTLGTEVDKSRIPEAVRSDATRTGDYHSHGDYSKNLINPKDGTSKIVRATKSENPESDHPSPGDKQRAGIIQQKLPNYRLFLGTPSKELKEYDSKKEKKL
jgi:RHS repeat-associated protein